MPRTTIQVSFQDAQAHVHEAVKKILLEAGYHEVAYGDEIVWKKGTGMLAAIPKKMVKKVMERIQSAVAHM